MKLNISFYLDKTDTLYQVYLSKYECTCGTFSLSWDSRMINAIDSSDNFFFSFSFAFLLFLFFSPFLFSAADEAARMKRVHCSRSRCLLLACITLASSERSFCSNEPAPLFTKDLVSFVHRFLHSRFDAWNYLWEVARVFSYYRYSTNFLFFSPLNSP